MATIRPASKADARGIAQILHEVGWFPAINAEPLEITETRVAGLIEHCHSDTSHLVLVAKSQAHEVIGYAVVHWLPYLILGGLEGYISELFVREAERGKGIGRELLQAIKERAAEHGCARLMLMNGRQRPAYARGFYQKNGWTERSEMANFVFPLSH